MDSWCAVEWGRVCTVSDVVETELSERTKKGFLAALWVNGVVVSASSTAVAVLVGTRHGTAAAGAVLGAGVLGRLLALWAERASLLSGVRVRTALAALCSLFFVLSCAVDSWLAPVAGSVLASGFGVLLVGMLMHSGSSMIPAASAAGMLGQASGMLAGGFLAAWGAAGVILLSAVGAVATLFTPWLCRGLCFEPHGDAEQGSSRAWMFPFALAVATYGPLALFSTIVTLELGPVWVGPGFLVYAAGSVAAAWLQRKSRVRRSTAALLAAAGSAVWVMGFETWWLMLAGRLVSGVLFFFAQGVVLTHAANTGERRSLTGALVGLGVGAQVAALWSGVVAEISVPVMAASAMLAGAALGVGARIWERTAAFKQV
jgi:hypothetical protein